jgi:hypothetical protein
VVLFGQHGIALMIKAKPKPKPKPKPKTETKIASLVFLQRTRSKALAKNPDKKPCLGA